MNRDHLERELRERLRPLSEVGEQQLVIATADEVVDALLPWIVETVEGERLP